MAQRKSTGLVNFMADEGSAQNALANGRLYIYSGAQPASADDAISGTLLVTLTKGGGAFTAETRAQWKFTLTNTTAEDTVTSIKVGSVELLSGTVIASATDDPTLATDIAANITANLANVGFTAVAVAGAVTITAPNGTGTSFNTASVVVTTSGVTVTYNDGGGTGAVFTTGVACVNGCNFTAPAAIGVLSKESTAWSGVAVATGTAGWFRYKADSADTDGSSTTFKRLDGAVSTSGAELNLSSVAITAGATITVNTGSFTLVK